MIPLNVLIVEDSEEDAALVVRELKKAGYSPAFKRVDSALDMELALADQSWDIILCDYIMPGFGGPAALKLLRSKDLDLPFIIVSGQIGEDIAVEAMRSGAHDYIMKGNLRRLGPAVRRELHEADNRRQRRQAERDLAASEAELRALTHRLLRAQEEERRAIARELHDQSGQSLTVLALLLDQLKACVSGEGVSWLKEAMEVIQEISSHIRGLSQSLRPGMLDDMGLLPTLNWYFPELKKRTGLAVDFHHSGLQERFDADVDITAFRIIQEALTNVVKYAGVKKASVMVARRDASLLIEIEDSGQGFDPARVPATTGGLRGIRERAYSVGGRAIIESSPGTGTKVTVQIPLEPPQVERRAA